MCILDFFSAQVWKKTWYWIQIGQNLKIDQWKKQKQKQQIDERNKKGIMWQYHMQIYESFHKNNFEHSTQLLFSIS